MMKHIFTISNWLIKNKNLKFKELFLLSGLYSIFLLAPTLFSLKMLDQIIIDKNVNGFIYLFIITIIILILSGLIDFYRYKIIDENLNNDYLNFVDKNYEHLIKYNIDFEKINKIKNAVQNNIIEVFIDIPWAIIYLLAFFLLHPLLGVSVFILLATQFYWISNKTTENQEITLKDYDIINKISSQFKSLNFMGMGSYLINYLKENKEKIDSKKNLYEKNIFSLEQKIKFHKIFFQLIIVSIGALLYINKEISLGSIIAISLLISKLLSPISILYSNWFKLIDSLELINILENKHPFKNNNNTNKKEIFNLIEGDILIIKGLNGSGKTKMIKEAIKKIQESNQSFGYLSQMPIFISGSIEEVVSNFTKKESDPKFNEKIKKSIILSGSDLFIQKLKDNTQEKLEKEKISMGELQKILLARAFFDSPKFILLDEPENHLDYISLDLIIKSIKELKEQGSIFIIATKNNQMEDIGTKKITLE